MTVRLLTDYPPYIAGNLVTLDPGTEAGLIAQHMADANTSGGTTYQAKVTTTSSGRAPVEIVGVPGTGNVLTAKPTGQLVATGYQWTRDGAAISGETASTYKQKFADSNHVISCNVTGVSYAANGLALGALGRDQFASAMDLNGSGIISATGYYTSTVTSERYNSRMKAEVAGNPLVNPVLAFAGFAVTPSGYVALPNSFTTQIAVEYNGINYPVTFDSGTSVKTIDSSATFFYSDPVANLVLPAGATFWIRAECIVATIGQFLPTGRKIYPTDSSVDQMIMNGNSSQVAGVGALALTGGANQSYVYAPQALLVPQAALTANAVLLAGDSIMAGSVSLSPDAYANQGWAQPVCRALNLPAVNQSRGSNRLQWSTPSYAAGLFVLTKCVTHSVIALGTNDANAGRSLAQMQADFLAIVTQHRADGIQKVFGSTIFPRTVSVGTNTPLSSAFDPGGSNIRGLFNAWLVTKVTDGTLNALFDPSPVVENGATGTWTNPSQDTIEGTHLTAAAELRVRTAFLAFLKGNI